MIWSAGDLGVHLHRNLNQKQHIFAFQIAPVTAVKLLDSITSSRIIKGQFLHAKPGQYWMQINNHHPHEFITLLSSPTSGALHC
jgi:hypothetical protein